MAYAQLHKDGGIMDKIILIGTGYMGREYCKVLNGLEKEFIVVGNRKESVAKFEQETGIATLSGGLENNTDVLDDTIKHAIVAVPACSLFYITQILIEYGIKSILVEKPGGKNSDEICALCDLAKQFEVDVYVAYNRRFYESVNTALKMINNNKEKIMAVDFEFTEWIDRIYEAHKSDKEPANIFFSNSSHVVDLAFFFSGLPKELSCYNAGCLEWTKNKTQYAGAGISERDVLVSYHANWESPGRWSLDVITDQHRYRFCPLEELKIQNKNSVIFENVALENKLDQIYKPGLYSMVNAFLNKNYDKERLLGIDEFQKCVHIYDKMEQ